MIDMTLLNKSIQGLEIEAQKLADVLDTISLVIKNTEKCLQQLDNNIEFEYRAIENTTSVAGINKIQSLVWRRRNKGKSGTFRIFLKTFHEIDNSLDEERIMEVAEKYLSEPAYYKPLIETDIRTRAKLVKYLPDFVEAFKENVKEHRLAITEGEKMNEICEWCKQDITGKPTEHMAYDNIFCSRKCAELFFEKMSEQQDAKKEDS